MLEQSLADRAKGRADLLKNAAAMQLRVVGLEEELKQVCEAAAAEKKGLEDELAKEKRKTQEANVQFNATSIGKVEILHHLFSCVSEELTSGYILVCCRLPQA
jgi:hypothetical protein